VLLLLLPHIESKHLNQELFVSFVLQTINIEPLVLLNAIEVLSNLGRVELIVPFWTLVVERYENFWPEIMGICSKEMYHLIEALIKQRQFQPLKSIIKYILDSADKSDDTFRKI
jgi:hypothetical protein